MQGRRDVLEAVPARGSGSTCRPAATPRSTPSRRCHHDLAAVCGGGDAGGAVDVHADVAVRVRAAARRCGSPSGRGPARRPATTAPQGLVALAAPRGTASPRDLEDDEEAVALGAHLHPAVVGPGLPQHLPLDCEGVGVCRSPSRASRAVDPSISENSIETGPGRQLGLSADVGARPGMPSPPARTCDWQALQSRARLHPQLGTQRWRYAA